MPHRALKPVLKKTAEMCRRIADKHGFEIFYFGARLVVPPGRPIEAFVNGALSNRLLTVDPEFVHAREHMLGRAIKTVLPFHWENINGEGFGAKQGVTVPLHGLGASGMLALGTSAALPKGKAAHDEMLKELHWAAIEAFQETVEGILEQAGSDRRAQLTARQHQALRLSAGGATLAQIGKKLGVHPSTARYLIGRAMAKLEVKTREEAIARIAALDGHAGDTHREARKAGRAYLEEHE